MSSSDLIYAPPAARRSRRFRSASAIILLAAPRFALSYIAYFMASLFLIDYRRTPAAAWGKLLVALAAAVLGLLISSHYGDVTVTGMIIEVMLLGPVLMYAAGFQPVRDWAFARRTVRGLNSTLFVLSILNLFVNGFPRVIPYVNIHPDIISAFYGAGGARDLTVIGFLGVLTEMTAHSRGEPRSTRAWLIALFNFLAPSYILGICCGLLALGITHARTGKRIVALIAAAVPSIWYALFVRVPALNHYFQDMTGYDPKAVPAVLIGRVFGAYPTLIPFGVGPGQFTSTPQSWLDPGLRAVSLHSVPSVPGLTLSSYETLFVQPFTSVATIHPAALGSAMSRPYDGIETMIVEWGLVGFLIMVAVVHRVAHSRNRTVWTWLLFFAALNILDLWTDNLWMGFGFLAATAVAMAPADAIRDHPDIARRSPRPVHA